jgi:autotransporter-associated beta strand protein
VQQGGSLTVSAAVTVNGNSVTAGAGGPGSAGDASGMPGSAFGTGMFLQGNGTLAFSPGTNQTQTISDGIADQTGSGGTGDNAGAWTLSKTGAGTLVLGGANTYSGGTTVTGGTLSISSSANLGAGGSLALENGTMLNYGASGIYSGHLITVAGDPSFNVGSGQIVNENDQITNGATPGTVEVTGGGTLQLNNTANSYSGGTTVTGNSTLIANDNAVLGNVSGGLTLGDATTGGTLETLGIGITSGRDITLGAGGGTVQVDDSGGTTTLQGNITGDGKLTKTGAGTLILTGSNDYGGGTTIFGGEVQGNTTSLQGDITNDANLVFNQDLAGTYGGKLSGTGSLFKNGNGALTLSGSNNYTGSTIVTGGTISISADDNLGNGGTLLLENGTGIAFTAGGIYTHPIKVTGDPTFNVGTGLTVTENGLISDFGGGEPAGMVQVIGGGTLVLGNASNSYSGGTTVTQGSTVSVAASLALGTGVVTLGDASTSGTLATTGSFTTLRDFTLAAGGGIFDTTSNVTTTLSGNVGGPGALTKIDDGTLILSGTNNHTGGTIVNGGTLEGTTLTLTGDITDNANVTFDQSANGSYGNVISGSGSVTKNGTGTVSITGAEGYTGATTVNTGTLQLAAGGSLASGGALTMTGGVFDIENGGQIVGSLAGTGGSVNLGNGGLTVDQTGTTSFAGGITGSNGLIKDGAGTLSLTGASYYTGSTEVDAGSLQLGAGGSLASTTSLTVNGGSFDLENGGQTVGALAGTGGSVNLGNGDLTVNEIGFTSYAGSIEGTGGLTKSGFGILALTCASDYAGATTVEAG